MAKTKNNEKSQVPAYIRKMDDPNNTNKNKDESHLYVDNSTAQDNGSNPFLDLGYSSGFFAAKHPFEQWQEQLVNKKQKDDHAFGVANHTYASGAIRTGQPHRDADFDDSQETPETFGPCMLPESFDPLESKDTVPINIELPKWTPEISTQEILAGAARDLADLSAVLVARRRIAIGYENDTKTIHELRHLALAISKLHYVVRDTPKPKKRRGRPRKKQLPNK